jgi:hypothetical protein
MASGRRPRVTCSGVRRRRVQRLCRPLLPHRFLLQSRLQPPFRLPRQRAAIRSRAQRTVTSPASSAARVIADASESRVTARTSSARITTAGADSPLGPQGDPCGHRGLVGRGVETLEDLLDDGLRAVCGGINPSPVSLAAAASRAPPAWSRGDPAGRLPRRRVRVTLNEHRTVASPLVSLVTEARPPADGHCYGGASEHSRPRPLF